MTTILVYTLNTRLSPLYVLVHNNILSHWIINQHYRKLRDIDGFLKNNLCIFVPNYILLYYFLETVKKKISKRKWKEKKAIIAVFVYKFEQLQRLTFKKNYMYFFEYRYSDFLFNDPLL